jgi:hypothetical protein
MSTTSYSITGIIVLVLFVSFMFRVLALLRRIAEGLDSLRAEMHAQRGTPTEVATRSTAASEAMKHHFR